MKIKINPIAAIPLLASFIAPMAMAESNITLYGMIDTGLTYVSNDGVSANYRADDSKMYGTRLGIKGAEDVGDGYKAIFTLENGFELNTGKSKQGGALFGRQAFVGLQNKWGAITLGNQYDFAADYILLFNISAFASGNSIHQGDLDRVGGNRLHNSIKLTSAKFNDITFGAMYSFGEKTNSLHDSSAWSSGIHYSNDTVALAAQVTYLNKPSGIAAIDPFSALGVTSFLGQTVATVDPTNGVVTNLFAEQEFAVDSLAPAAIAGSYTVGKMTYMGNITSTVVKGYGNQSTMQVVDVGGLYYLSPALFVASGYQHTRFEGNRWQSISAGMTYALSKRTSLYFGGDYLKADDGVYANIGYNFAPSKNATQWITRLGIFHSF